MKGRAWPQGVPQPLRMLLGRLSPPACGGGEALPRLKAWYNAPYFMLVPYYYCVRKFGILRPIVLT